ncbi:hypothetical protein EV178_004089 [Coemansia sp. RSA 1646]|nr:hypothetical protein EV178_004089 [Coemansia sp. RSA 1646]
MDKLTRLYRVRQPFCMPATNIKVAQRFYSASHQASGQQEPQSNDKKDSHQGFEEIGVLKAYGKPVATIFLWSALTYMALQAVWSKLYFDEVRLETEAKIDDLKEELDKLEQNHRR